MSWGAMPLRPFLFILAFAASACRADVLCPSSHLEPTVSYGHAFGGVDRATISANLGSISDDELVFQYFEYQTRDPGYASVYGIHLLQNEKTKEGRLFLTRLRGATPVREEVKLPADGVDAILSIASPIVQQTHYPAQPCSVAYTDGFVIEAASGSPGSPSLLHGGAAYTPVAGSAADQLVQLGRLLRKLCLHEGSEQDIYRAIASTRAQSG